MCATKSRPQKKVNCSNWLPFAVVAAMGAAARCGEQRVTRIWQHQINTRTKIPICTDYSLVKMKLVCRNGHSKQWPLIDSHRVIGKRNNNCVWNIAIAPATPHGNTLWFHFGIFIFIFIAHHLAQLNKLPTVRPSAVNSTAARASSTRRSIAMHRRQQSAGTNNLTKNVFNLMHATYWNVTVCAQQPNARTQHSNRMTISMAWMPTMANYAIPLVSAGSISASIDNRYYFVVCIRRNTKLFCAISVDFVSEFVSRNTLKARNLLVHEQRNIPNFNQMKRPKKRALKKINFRVNRTQQRQLNTNVNRIEQTLRQMEKG